MSFNELELSLIIENTFVLPTQWKGILWKKRHFFELEIIGLAAFIGNPLKLLKIYSENIFFLW